VASIPIGLSAYFLIVLPQLLAPLLLLAKEHGIGQDPLVEFDKLSVVFAVLIAVLFFGERVSFLHGVAIAMIAGGGLMLAIFP